MTVALIIAGGSGNRMQSEIPKQFIEVCGKPVLVHTLERFQKHSQIEAIEVVCLDGWVDDVWTYAQRYHISKLKWVTLGGKTVQESIRNGVSFLHGKCKKDDVVVIHDGIRPYVDQLIISDVIAKCLQYGNGVTAMPYNEQLFVTEDEQSTIKYIPRDAVRRVSTPQAYRFGKLSEIYQKAFAKGIGIQKTAYTNTMMVEMGERLYFALGSEKNIKLTTPDDMEIFLALLSQGKNQN